MPIIKEIVYDGGPGELYREWFLSVRCTAVILQRYGTFCTWDKLVLSDGRVEMYRLTLDDERREEYFFGCFFRSYDGDQFSFIEYIQEMLLKEGFPEKTMLARKGIQPSLIDTYSRFASCIFC